ncbi:hypothetical protein M153_16300011598 [Pseudoloma neurophilia]|uniref:Uncharacterized protein n=1 Tax=Pseudoloma neurophilia TaxID=146866 RepID=A0A0R0M5A1_9MICR|nr:hypothetical protein M153_16300011598 [Pseudoloma neurophilia]
MKKETKGNKKVKHSPIPAFKRTDNCPLTRDPKIKGIRNYLKRIRAAIEEEQRQDANSVKMNEDLKPNVRQPDFFANPFSPSLSFTSLRLCQLTHLPANYTDSRSRLEAYDKSVLLMIKEMTADQIKMANSVKGFGRDLGLG